jgi:4-amino-4-deoxy-L-arabinose transferase-like glycosyltransferase
MTNLLRSRRTYATVVAILFAVFAGELWLSVAQLSQTIDEGAHLYSGYQYWRAGDFGLNPEHPPLVKFVAAAPLLSLSLQQPHPPRFSSKAEEYIGGVQLIYGNNADKLLFRARVAVSIFSLLLASLVFVAGYEMFGATVALIALFLCVFEPNLLAHGALVTTDMGATVTIFGAVYAAYRYAKQPTLPRMIVVGLALGLAAIAKFSAIVLLPILGFALLVELGVRWRRNALTGQSPRAMLHPLLRLSLHIAAAILIAWTMVWTAYGFRYQARPAGMALSPTLVDYAQQLPSHVQTRIILWLAHWHVLPEAYLYGLVDVRVFGSQIPSFLLGRVHPGPTWKYFPLAFLIKATLPMLALLLLLPFVAKGWKSNRRELVYLSMAPILYLMISLAAPQNIGVRHILPMFPFVILLAAVSAWLLAQRSRAGYYAVLVLLLFSIVTSLRIFPDYLAYSNEAVGGPSHGYRLLTDSNVDWGQSIKEVREYVVNKHIQDCWFVPTGGAVFSNAKYYGIPCKPLPSMFERAVGGPLPIIPETVHGTVLVSATEAAGLFSGSGGSLDPYWDLLWRKPDDMIGHAVLVFHGDVHLPLAAAEGHESAAIRLLRAGKPEQALAEARTAVALAPSSPDAQATLGAVLWKQNQRDQAQQAFQTARTLAHTQDPEDLMQTDRMITSLQE